MGILIKRGDPIDHILNVYLPTESADNLPDFTHYVYKIHTLFQNNDTVYNMAVGDFKANLMKQSIFCSELIKFCYENDYVLGDQGKLPGQKKVDWGKLPVETVSNYMHTTDVSLKDLVLADDVITCSGGHCTIQVHVDMLSNTYGHIMNCFQKADEICIPKKHKKLFTPVPGWNQYLSEPYNESRQAYILWSSYNKPRSGPVHEIIKITRARFRYAQRLVGKNEETLRADA